MRFYIEQVDPWQLKGASLRIKAAAESAQNTLVLHS